MQVREGVMVFNEEDRWIAALPESDRLDKVNIAFSKVLLARSHCYNKFFEVVMASDASDEDIDRLPRYVERLRSLEELSEQLVPFMMPHILGEFEQTLPG